MGPAPRPRPTPRARGERNGHGLVAVGPGLAASVLLGGTTGGFPMNPLPVQPVKIHCPPPRDDTLSRERLNSWLDRAAAGRLGLIVAEAGFGKTTLLADWAVQTTRMTAWYRLEADDRDWLTFIRHLVASGREIDPGFAPQTLDLLGSLGPGGPTQHDLTVSIAREMAEFGTGSSHGLTLIFDDYHVVDGCPDTDPIVRALLDRTAPGYSVVIATRSTPAFPLGRIRARGGVLAIEGRDLCFDLDETSRLFRDAYRQPLDAQVAADLCDRTEGWAALLTLVRTSIEEHNDPRVLVAHLDASRGDLYDFLAEEVLATLPPELQHFLTRVAVLTAVDVNMAVLVDERPADDIAVSIRESERLGLLSRPDRESPHRFHPLVREFLVARLTAEIGEAAVRDLHQALGTALENSAWLPATWHYRAAGDMNSAARTLDAAIPSIIASGGFELARQFLDGSAGPPDRPGVLILRSRLELERGHLARAIELAQLGSQVGEGTSLASLGLLNLTAILARHGFDEQSIKLATRAMEGDLAPAERMVAEASLAVWSTQQEGSLAAVADYLVGLAQIQDAAGHVRYAGITRLNLAVILLWMGRSRDAADVAGTAELSLGASPTSPERVAAIAVRIAAQLQLGATEPLDRMAALIDEASTPVARDEAAIEAARLLGDYGSLERAESAAARVGQAALSTGYLGAWAVATGTIALRRGEPVIAAERVALAGGALQDAAGKFRVCLLRARISLATRSRLADGQIAELTRIAAAQGSRLEAVIADLLRGLQDGRPDGAVARLMPDEDHVLSMLADEVCRSLPELDTESRLRVTREATLRPDRWITALRMVYQADPLAARLLADIGNEHDASALRAAAASRKWLRPIAAEITHRLAPRVLIHDLGPVTVQIGVENHVRTLRRKVMGLLCFVASRPGMAATRDEALDAIWPDLGPDTAVNSLHQTIYYLRRVFEPTYREGTSAGYVEFDGDVLSLHPALVDSQSRKCQRLVDVTCSDKEDALDQLVATYRGRYALDFTYEDWATSYRENLHASVLASVESGIRRATAEGNIDRATRLAQAMLAVDPGADGIELALLKAYKAGDRHAAAAEQYAHYAAYIRGELGADPPRFDDI